MVEYVAVMWTYAPRLGLAVIVIALAWGVVRIWRSRRPSAPARTLRRTLSPDDPAKLDSSHIGGPLLETTVDPGGRS